jgi:hypothetical protein
VISSQIALTFICPLKRGPDLATETLSPLLRCRELFYPQMEATAEAKLKACLHTHSQQIEQIFMEEEARIMEEKPNAEAELVVSRADLKQTQEFV